jgi:hypothetical protein
MNGPVYKLLSWINPESIQWSDIWLNPNNPLFFSKTQNEYKNWRFLARNPSAINIVKNKLKQDPDILCNPCLNDNSYNKIHWTDLCLNTSDEAVEIIKNNLDKIHWVYFSQNSNPKAIEILKNNLDKVDWYYLSQNPGAIEILENNKDKIKLDMLCGNPKAIHIIEKMLTDGKYISWYNLSSNSNAMHILEKNLDKVSWCKLSENPKAIYILEKNREKIIGWCLARNPSIFVLDYSKIEENNSRMKKEIIEKSMHPNRIDRILSLINPKTEKCYTFNDAVNIFSCN